MAEVLEVGKLDRRLTIQRATYSTNALNEKVATWGDLATMWTQVSYKNARERIENQQLMGTLMTRFVVRWNPDIANVTPEDRILYEGRIYDIHGVYEFGRHIGLEIHATARAD